MTPFADVVGQSVTVSLPGEVTLDRLDLELVADGRHSVPTKLEIISDTGERRSVDVPAVDDAATPDAISSVPVQFEPLAGSRFRVRVAEVRKRPVALCAGALRHRPQSVQDAARQADRFRELVVEVDRVEVAARARVAVRQVAVRSDLHLTMFVHRPSLTSSPRWFLDTDLKT